MKAQINYLPEVLYMISIAEISESTTAHAQSLLKRIDSGEPCRCVKGFLKALARDESDRVDRIFRMTDNEHLLDAI